MAGTRTPDQCLKRALLYQLSYQPTNIWPLMFTPVGINTEAGKSRAVAEREKNSN